MWLQCGVLPQISQAADLRGFISHGTSSLTVCQQQTLYVAQLSLRSTTPSPNILNLPKCTVPVLVSFLVHSTSVVPNIGIRPRSGVSNYSSLWPKVRVCSDLMADGKSCSVLQIGPMSN